MSRLQNHDEAGTGDAGRDLLLVDSEEIDVLKVEVTVTPGSFVESAADVSVPSERVRGEVGRWRCVSTSMHSAAGHSRPTIEMQLPDFDTIRHIGSELIST